MNSQHEQSIRNEERFRCQSILLSHAAVFRSLCSPSGLAMASLLEEGANALGRSYPIVYDTNTSSWIDNEDPLWSCFMPDLGDSDAWRYLFESKESFYQWSGGSDV